MVLRMEDNRSPYLTMVETAEPAAPDAGEQRLYVDPVTHILMITDSAGVQVPVGSAAVTDATIATSDITTNNASTSKHGWLKKLDNNAAHFMDGTGAWSTPSSGFSDPMTTRGDIIVRDASNVTARLAIGSSGKVLSSNGTDISWQTPSVGGITQAYVGYNTVGGSFETTASNGTWYFKSVTLANDCLITNIEGYFQHASGTAAGPACGLFTDSGGHPLKYIGGMPGGNGLLKLDANGARWIGAPLGQWVTAGTYWIAMRTTDLGYSATVALQIAYDTGSDETKVQAQYQSLDVVSSTVTARKYSIRANTIR